MSQQNKQLVVIWIPEFLVSAIGIVKKNRRQTIWIPPQYSNSWLTNHHPGFKLHLNIRTLANPTALDYSNHPNTGLAWYLDDWNLLSWWMVLFSNGNLLTKLDHFKYKTLFLHVRGSRLMNHLKTRSVFRCPVFR